MSQPHHHQHHFDNTGAKGEHAGEEVKGFFKTFNVGLPYPQSTNRSPNPFAQNASESLRTNINSFADDLLGGSHSTRNTAGGTGTIHPDAKKTGHVVQENVDAAGAKLEHAVGDQHQTKRY